ncbi:MAG: hypothetical protein EXR75_13100 [Myxococcales bacterium]|nr:hypothetical protein [Myxococcales bacterium]
MAGAADPGGIGVADFAGVAAALAEGFPLAKVLETQRLDGEAWPAADVWWKQRLAEDGAKGGALFLAYQAALADSEDWLARTIKPLDDDLEAWLGFLGAWSSSKDPSVWLKQTLQLNGNDVSRLRRRWGKRIEEDTELAILAAKLATQGPKPLPRLEIAPAVLRRYSWSKRAAEAPRANQVAGPAAPLVEDFPVDRYARLCAELAALPAARAQVLKSHGLDLHTHKALELRWNAALAANAQLAADHRRLVAHHRARLDTARRAAADAKKAAESGPPVNSVASAANLAPEHRPAVVLPALGLARPDLPALGLARPDLPAVGLARPVDDSRPSAAEREGSIDETGEMSVFLFDDPLPFIEGATAIPVSTETDSDDVAGNTAFLDADFAAALIDALPFEEPPDSSRASVALSLEQLAAVAVEVTLMPSRAESIYQMYGLTLDGARTAFAELEQQRRSDRSMSVRWDEAYARYHAYRTQQG